MFELHRLDGMGLDLFAPENIYNLQDRPADERPTYGVRRMYIATEYTTSTHIFLCFVHIFWF